jgi:phosphoesterase RecJ-like protein
MSKRIRQQIIDTLLKSKKILLTGHANPDGDSLGSILGLAEALHRRNISYQIANAGGIPDKYRFLPGTDQIIGIGNLEILENDFDTAVVIECSNLERIGEVQKLIGENCQIINIDHHQDNTSFGHINLKCPEASAAGEIVYDILVQGNFALSSDIATNLYTAILTDTGRFHYNNTTPRCLRTAADLIDLGADPVYITEQVYYQQSPARLKLTGLVLSGLDYLAEGRFCVMTINRAMMSSAKAQNSDTEGLVNQSLSTTGVEVGALFTEVSDKLTKVSLRSQDQINVAEIASHYGGGGHFNASGFTLQLPLAEAKNRVIKYIEDKVNGTV